jgi:hypothetical protein
MKRKTPTTEQINGGVELTSKDSNTLDTSTLAQRQRIFNHLIKNGSINTLFARDRLNIMAPAPRIKELREQGHNIFTDRIVINDRDGRSHSKVALYILLEVAAV